MLDPVMRKCADDVIERLVTAAKTLDNARAFRAFVEDLHRRDLTVVQGARAGAIIVARASFVRSTISAIMAVLDPPDYRGNRASIGQILRLLEDPNVAAALTDHAARFGQPAESRAGAPTIASVGAAWDRVRKDDRYNRAKDLRNDLLAHVLVSEHPTPTVPYEDIFSLHDDAHRMVADLLELCLPHYHFVSRLALEHQAKVFWDTYFAGMVAVSSAGQNAA